MHAFDLAGKPCTRRAWHLILSCEQALPVISLKKVQAHHCGHRRFYFFPVAMPVKHAPFRASQKVGGLSSVKNRKRAICPFSLRYWKQAYKLFQKAFPSIFMPKNFRNVLII